VLVADQICTTLKVLGARIVFGLPGTQNALLYEALRTSGLRSVVASDEGAAAFMAAGYARANGQPAVLTTIPGPGFLYALPGIAEARDDSAPVLWLTLRAKSSDHGFPLQAIDQPAIAGPLVKRVIAIEHATDLATGLAAAWRAALDEEPGPVLVELGATLLSESAVGTTAATAAALGAAAMGAILQQTLVQLVARLRACEKPLIIAGQGAKGCAAAVRALAHAWNAPVIFTCSGRGVLADDDALAFVQDFSMGIGEVVPAMLERADLVLALGCKFTHNGSCGGRLALRQETLVRIDSSAAVLAANYPASLAVHTRLEQIVPALEAAGIGRKTWDPAELQRWRQQLAAQRRQPIEHEPQLEGCGTATLMSFFAALAHTLGSRALYTADAGLHQLLTRRYAVVGRPRGLLCPSDFQSMGFGLPGAIGAALAQADAHVVACIGDGGLALSAGELLTAVREGLTLAVVVFNDRSYGLIRRQQIANYGHASGVDLLNPDLAMLADAVGCNFLRAEGDVDMVARQIAGARGVTLIELRLSDAPSFERARLKGVVKARLRTAVPDSFWQRAKRLLRR
jgi:acetolactate synthase-1/2/3 large subunit